MAKWRFWQRNNVEASELPEEVKEYYETTRAEKRGTAWLLAGATLVATLILASGMFLGGKFVYQKFSGDEPTTGEVIQNTTDSNESPVGGPPPTNDANEGTSTTRGNEDLSSDTDDTESTPTTGSSELTDSGPGDILAIFVATVVISTLAYELITPHYSKKLSQ